jgi:NADPH:quinone reductase-like Zn-dependent oxidoreductase
MKALVQVGYGSPGKVALQEVPQPSARAGDLLVKVHAAGLNAADRLLLRGEPFAARALAGGLRRPRSRFVVGRAFAGRVEAVGEDVQGYSVGDEVLAEAVGAVGEFAVVPARLAARKPVGLTFIEAAALPLAGTTALQGVRGIQRGQRVLVTGASGGVGSFAVQLAVASGAAVTAVCASRNAAMTRSLGAERVIDYQRTSGAEVGALWGKYDVILDLAGNYSVKDLRGALAPGGTLLLSAGTGGRWLGPVRRNLTAKIAGRRQVRAVFGRPDAADLTSTRSVRPRPHSTGSIAVRSPARSSSSWSARRPETAWQCRPGVVGSKACAAVSVVRVCRASAKGATRGNWVTGLQGSAATSAVRACRGSADGPTRRRESAGFQNECGDREFGSGRVLARHQGLHPRGRCSRR